MNLLTLLKGLFENIILKNETDIASSHCDFAHLEFVRNRTIVAMYDDCRIFAKDLKRRLPQ